MATRGTGSGGGPPWPTIGATQWDSATQSRADNEWKRLDRATGGRGDPDKVYPPPKPRWGYPGIAKGAIYALDPNDYSQGDTLLFSRYPEELNQRMEAVLASGGGPGRAYPHFQQMGGRGMQLSVELWFCDAFMWSLGPLRFRTQRVTVNGISSDPTNFVLTHAREPEAKGTLAEQARRFLEFYTIGHDGTGVALPPADLFLHWGGAPRPIPIILKSADLRLAQFTSPGDPLERERGGAGAPQEVTARLEMEVNIPVRMVNPFRPAQTKPGRGRAPQRKLCPTPGYTADMARVIRSAVSGTAFGEFSLPGALEAATGSPVVGLGPPRQGGVGQ